MGSNIRLVSYIRPHWVPCDVTLEVKEGGRRSLEGGAYGICVASGNKNLKSLATSSSFKYQCTFHQLFFLCSLLTPSLIPSENVAAVYLGLT